MFSACNRNVIIPSRHIATLLVVEYHEEDVEDQQYPIDGEVEVEQNVDEDQLQ